MGQVVTIGLDIAKSVFQVHGVDASGATVLHQRLTRSKLLPFFEKLPRCLVGIEACATSHHWARQLITLRRSGGPATVGLPDSAQCSHPLPAPSATWPVP